MLRSTLTTLAVLASSLAFAACGSDAATPAPDPAPASNVAPPAAGGAPDGGVDASSSDGSPGPATKSVRFVATGDTGTGTPEQTKIGNAIAAKCTKDGCDFVQLLGDNFYPSGAASVDDAIWQTHFETPYAAVNLDFFAVLGNHDYGADGAGTDFAKGKNEVDYTLKSKKWKMPAAYYHHAKGNVEFVALDTNMQLFGQDAAQKKDVAAWLKASTSEWKIAFGHHPYKSNGPHGNAGNYDKIPISPISGKNVKTFLDDVVCGKVDVYFCGHDHSQQWLNESCNGTELAVSGAGAKTTELPGSNPTLFQSLALGFLYVVVDGKKLTAEFVDEDGKVEFTHVITKP
ncbi:hypothetical protein BH11MYX4_BH11MYX4_54230 [soil metagenome]